MLGRQRPDRGRALGAVDVQDVEPVPGSQADVGQRVAGPPGQHPRPVRWPAVLVWLLGFLVYNWINPGTVAAWVSLLDGVFADLLRLPFPLSARLPWLGASLPALAVSFLAMLAVGRRRTSRARAGGHDPEVAR
jgi:hypothetical protein